MPAQDAYMKHNVKRSLWQPELFYHGWHDAAFAQKFTSKGGSRVASSSQCTAQTSTERTKAILRDILSAQAKIYVRQPAMLSWPQPRLCGQPQGGLCVRSTVLPCPRLATTVSLLSIPHRRISLSLFVSIHIIIPAKSPIKSVCRMLRDLTQPFDCTLLRGQHSAPDAR